MRQKEVGFHNANKTRHILDHTDVKKDGIDNKFMTVSVDNKWNRSITTDIDGISTVIIIQVWVVKTVNGWLSIVGSALLIFIEKMEISRIRSNFCDVHAS